MKKWSHIHRLRKYRRKKMMAFKSHNPRLDHYLQMYWNYSAHVHGHLGPSW
jgi:hypothetical protein